MSDRRSEEGPLSSEELESDRDLISQDEDGSGLTEEDAGGHTLPASEADVSQGSQGQGNVGGHGGVAGTMLPPD